MITAFVCNAQGPARTSSASRNPASRTASATWPLFLKPANQRGRAVAHRARTSSGQRQTRHDYACAAAYSRQATMSLVQVRKIGQDRLFSLPRSEHVEDIFTRMRMSRMHGPATHWFGLNGSDATGLMAQCYSRKPRCASLSFPVTPLSLFLRIRSFNTRPRSATEHRHPIKNRSSCR